MIPDYISPLPGMGDRSATGPAELAHGASGGTSTVGPERLPLHFPGPLQALVGPWFPGASKLQCLIPPEFMTTQEHSHLR